MPSLLEEFLLVVRRDLGAEDARILSPGDALPEDDGSGVDLRQELPGGRWLLVTFASPPPDLPARRTRVEMLVDAFDAVLAPEKGAMARPPPALSLHEELRALAERAGAADAIVIDARSPVVWGAAAEVPPLVTDAVVTNDVAPEARLIAANDAALETPDDALAQVESVPPAAARPDAVSTGSERPAEAAPVPPPGKPGRTLFIVRAPREDAAAEARDSLSERAIRAVRALPETATLHKGGQLHCSFSDPGLGVFARSFAGIYVLVLAFRAPFDELRAKRAVVQALPAIERLVLLLPPLDPAPRMGGVVALRPRLRRR